MLNAGNLKLTTLSENSVSRAGVSAEWGLSILVEAEDRKILLDTGGGQTGVQNADRLGTDLRTVDTIVLSHSHFDHSLGLEATLSRIDGDVPVIAHPAVWDLKYGYRKKTEEYYFLGIPFRREYLESLGARFSLSKDPQWITDDICASGEEPMVTEFETVPDTFFRKEGGRYEPDDILDDQSLYIRTDLGLVVVLGCAHRGVINVINHARTVMNTENVYMVVGGTHLIAADEERIRKTIDALKQIDVSRIGVSHCTGFEASAALSSAFPDRFFTNNTGTVIKFPYE